MQQNFERSSGVLMPIFSLNSQFGVGSLGKSAREFGLLLCRCGQKYWQILPLSPVDGAYSPYAAQSAFAGNEMLIDLDDLAAEGYFSATELRKFRRKFDSCDYAYAKSVQAVLFPKAFEVFCRRGGQSCAEFTAFCAKNKFWLDDYATFCGLKKCLNAAHRLDLPQKNAALAANLNPEELARQILFCKFLQFIFLGQLSALCKFLHKHNVEFIGDIPFYAADDSADVWAHSGLFMLDGSGRAKLVAGVPPDYFSADGQLWGNPIYNFEAMRADNYAWFVSRFTHWGQYFGALRIDHFRAFDTYFAIENGRQNARVGRWEKGGGMQFFSALRQKAPALRLIAEDLGDIGPSVLQLRREAGLPGMKVLQFAFDTDPNNPFLPHNYEAECAAYIGTHDNDTARGFWENLNAEARQRALDFALPNSIAAEVSARRAVEILMEYLANSKANLVVFCAQDLAFLDSSRRINIPGTTDGCWKLMLQKGEISPQSRRFLRRITAKSRRINKK